MLASMKYSILLAIALISAALTAAAPDAWSFAAEFGKRWMAARKLAIGVAEAMPPNEYAFKPDPPSMNFGEQMVHIAAINYAFCAALRDAKSPSPSEPAEKPAIVKFLADSFDYCFWRYTFISRTIAGRRKCICA